MSVFIDLCKAFDTVNHDVLCTKLDHYGIKGGVLSWCKHYLLNRTQQTLANNVKSSERNVQYGVPQGSVLGPLFFILYVNDLQHAFKNVKVQLYADDTVLYLSGSDPKMVQEHFQKDLNRLHKWCQCNKLTLNPSKTKMMLFGTRHSIKKFRACQLNLNGKIIQKVSTFKYLGFILDSTLSFKIHVADVIKKVIHKRLLLSKVMGFLNKNTAISIFKLMILPYFDYCDVIYMNACMNSLDKLQRLQNKCLKTCLGLHKLCETKTVHKQASCAFLAPRREAHLCNFMYKRQMKNELLDIRDIRTRQHDAPLFIVPFPNKELYKRSIQYAGSVLWNSLPATTRATDNYLVFKTLQKRKMCESFK